MRPQDADDRGDADEHENERQTGFGEDRRTPSGPWHIRLLRVPGVSRRDSRNQQLCFALHPDQAFVAAIVCAAPCRAYPDGQPS
ncbi:hypothetical protein CS0771_65790 [Catellatospora sp. IY07-71]|nr:hypothetical protein CS0771_65790 [Catellatospora sp. IY07-71]